MREYATPRWRGAGNRQTSRSQRTSQRCLRAGRRETEGTFRREGEWRAGNWVRAIEAVPRNRPSRGDTTWLSADAQVASGSTAQKSRHSPLRGRGCPLPDLCDLLPQRGFPFLSLRVSSRHRRIPGVTPMTPSLSLPYKSPLFSR